MPIVLVNGRVPAAVVTSCVVLARASSVPRKDRLRSACPVLRRPTYIPRRNLAQRSTVHTTHQWEALDDIPTCNDHDKVPNGVWLAKLSKPCHTLLSSAADGQMQLRLPTTCSSSQSSHKVGCGPVQALCWLVAVNFTCQQMSVFFAQSATRHTGIRRAMFQHGFLELGCSHGQATANAPRCNLVLFGKCPGAPSHHHSLSP